MAPVTSKQAASNVKKPSANPLSSNNPKTSCTSPYFKKQKDQEKHSAKPALSLSALSETFQFFTGNNSIHQQSQQQKFPFKIATSSSSAYPNYVYKQQPAHSNTKSTPTKLNRSNSEGNITFNNSLDFDQQQEEDEDREREDEQNNDQFLGNDQHSNGASYYQQYQQEAKFIDQQEQAQDDTRVLGMVENDSRENENYHEQELKQTSENINPFIPYNDQQITQVPSKNSSSDSAYFFSQQQQQQTREHETTPSSKVESFDLQSCVYLDAQSRPVLILQQNTSESGYLKSYLESQNALTQLQNDHAQLSRQSIENTNKLTELSARNHQLDNDNQTLYTENQHLKSLLTQAEYKLRVHENENKFLKAWVKLEGDQVQSEIGRWEYAGIRVNNVENGIANVIGQAEKVGKDLLGGIEELRKLKKSLNGLGSFYEV